MRFKIAFLILFISINCVFAQSKSLRDTAFSAFHVRHYSEAVKLYKQVIESEKNQRYHSDYAGLMLSTCYTRLDSLEQAKNILIKIVYPETPVTSVFMIGLQESARGNLAEIYFKEKSYKDALACYRLHDGKWAGAHFADVNEFEVNYNRAISMSKCYEGLGLKDSAIVALTPYMFSSYRQLGYFFKVFSTPKAFKDSLKHDSVCMRYLNLLKKRYSIKNIKAELAKTEREFTYTQTLSHKGKDTTFLWLEVVCNFHFYGIKVPYMDYETLGDDKKIIAFSKQPQFTREYQLAYFLTLPLCRMIRELH